MMPTIYLLVALVATQVGAFPGGAPRSACGSMKPVHMLFSAQETDEPPFSIKINTQQVRSISSADVAHPNAESTRSGVTVTITSDGDTEFKGFFLQARVPGSTDSIGTFTVLDGGKTIDCGSGTSNAATHDARTKKSTESFLWTPPLDFQGQVNFFATVVVGFRTFYTELQSAPVFVTLTKL